jgi:hypothetical protein
MARIRRRIAAIGLSTVFAIGANLTVSAQAPVPVRKASPPPPPAGQPQPTPSAPVKSITVTLHCSVGGISTDLFSTSGLRCPNPTSPGKCDYVILTGWAPAGLYARDSRFDKLDFTCTSTGSVLEGFYDGVSATPGGIATFRTKDSTQVCVSKFPTTEGWRPENTELIVRGPFPCL